MLIPAIFEIKMVDPNVKSKYPVLSTGYDSNKQGVICCLRAVATKALLL